MLLKSSALQTPNSNSLGEYVNCKFTEGKGIVFSIFKNLKTEKLLMVFSSGRGGEETHLIILDHLIYTF